MVSGRKAAVGGKAGRLTSVLMLLAAFLGCSYSHEASATEQSSYDARLYTRLELVTENGEIAASAGSDSLICVTLTRRAAGRSERQAEERLAEIGIHVTEDTAAGLLRIVVDAPGDGGYGCDADITVPESLYVDFSTTNRRVRVEGLHAGLRIETSNAEISLARTAGDAELATSGGKITVDLHDGDIAASTSNAEVEAEVVMPASNGRCLFSTSNRAVTVAVPDSVGASVKLSTTFEGALNVDAALPLGPDANRDEDVFEAVMGDGSGRIELETSNADITLKRL